MQNIALPGKWSLSQVTGLPRLKGTEDGQTEINKMNEASHRYKTQLRWCKIIKWVFFIFSLPFLNDQGNKWIVGILLILIGAFGFTRKGLVAKHFTQEYDAAVDRYYNYWDQLASFVGGKILPGWRYNRFDLIYIIYSNDGVLYMNVNNDLLVGYKKSNIKEVTRERLHIGSHTTGDTTGVGVAGSRSGSSIGVGVGKARTNSDTTDYYEWHFDIMSDFMGYPKMSLVVSDTPNHENMINEMYAILKP